MLCVYCIFLKLCISVVQGCTQNTHSRYSLSPKQEQAQISGLCGLLNTYRRTHRAVCHSCLQESDLWGLWTGRGNTDMNRSAFSEEHSGGYATVAFK